MHVHDCKSSECALSHTSAFLCSLRSCEMTAETRRTKIVKAAPDGIDVTEFRLNSNFGMTNSKSLIDR